MPWRAWLHPKCRGICIKSLCTAKEASNWQKDEQKNYIALNKYERKKTKEIKSIKRR
jgi:hypothetical protein